MAIRDRHKRVQMDHSYLLATLFFLVLGVGGLMQVNEQLDSGGQLLFIGLFLFGAGVSFDSWMATAEK